jgi:hypothetical protein
MSLTNALKSGLGGVAGMVAANHPDLLKGAGVLGNIAANRLEKDEEKKRAAMEAIKSGRAPVVPPPGMKKGGRVKSKSTSGYKSGGSVKSSASKRADGCAQRGKTRGKMV